MMAIFDLEDCGSSPDDVDKIINADTFDTDINFLKKSI